MMMKRIIAVLLAVVMLALCACNKGSRDTDDAEPTKSVQDGENEPDGGNDDPQDGSQDASPDNGDTSSGDQNQLSPQKIKLSECYRLGENCVMSAFDLEARANLLICFNDKMEPINSFPCDSSPDIIRLSDDYFVLRTKKNDEAQHFLFDSQMNNLSDEYPGFAEYCYYGGTRCDVFDDNGLKYYDCEDKSTYNETVCEVSVHDLKTGQVVSSISLDKKYERKDVHHVGGSFFYANPYLFNCETGMIAEVGFFPDSSQRFLYYENNRIYCLYITDKTEVSCYNENGEFLWRHDTRDNFDIATGEERISFRDMEEREGQNARIYLKNPHVSSYSYMDSLNASHYGGGYAVLKITNNNGSFYVLANQDGDFLLGPYSENIADSENWNMSPAFIVTNENGAFKLNGLNGTMDIPEECVTHAYADGEHLRQIIKIENNVIYFNNADGDPSSESFFVTLDISSVV